MNDEWYTPAEHLELARKVMGGIDLDPASCELAQQVVRAGHFYTAEQDGLVQPWAGRIWLNPPYSRGLISKFARKLLEEWRAGRIEQAVVLVNAHPDGRWFQRLSAEFVLCLTHKRIRFWDGTRTVNPRFPSAFFYAGADATRFKRVFRRLGVIVEPTPVATCERCRKAFTPRHRDAKHCSKLCCNASSVLKEDVLGMAVPLHASCEYCGRPMPGARSHARFCSTRCRVAAYRAHAKETP